jgi:hypothetical protein
MGKAEADDVGGRSVRDCVETEICPIEVEARELRRAARPPLQTEHEEVLVERGYGSGKIVRPVSTVRIGNVSNELKACGAASVPGDSPAGIPFIQVGKQSDELRAAVSLVKPDVLVAKDHVRFGTLCQLADCSVWLAGIKSSKPYDPFVEARLI